MPDSPTILIRAGAVRDARGLNARPGAIALREGKVIAGGEPSQVRREAGEPDRVIDLPDSLVMPAMVNAHAHLDLTGIGPQPYAGDFIQWIERVMRERPTDDAAITKAVQRGLRQSREAGVGVVGDIAGSIAAIRARFAMGYQMPRGISYLECFGLGRNEPVAADQARRRRMQLIDELDSTFPDDWPFLIGLEAHAPYSAGLALYDEACEQGCGHASTHLAETLAELEFVRDGTGPFAELLRRLGKWDDSIRGTGLSPVQHLAPILEKGDWVIAHCNYVTDDDIATLAAMATVAVTVAYCPVASDYFGHRNHRYRQMIEAGINVCLGTDSILCQPADEKQPLGILPQMRHVYRRDRTDPDLLLAMATVRGRLPFNYWPEGSFERGMRGQFLHVRFDAQDDTDALVQVLLNDEPALPVALDPV
ncbi:MAG: amidohydrolase family protein [Phycisphaeraceae bacterium]